MVIFDTNIIIDHLRTPRSQKSLLVSCVEKYPKTAFGLSIISVQELYEGKSTLLEEKETDLLATISPLTLFSYTYETAKFAGMLARDIDRPIELADAAIAATAILNNLELYTLNGKDFKNLPDLQLFKP